MFEVISFILCTILAITMAFTKFFTRAAVFCIKKVSKLIPFKRLRKSCKSSISPLEPCKPCRSCGSSKPDKLSKSYRPSRSHRIHNTYKTLKAQKAQESLKSFHSVISYIDREIDQIRNSNTNISYVSNQNQSQIDEIEDLKSVINRQARTASHDSNLIQTLFSTQDSQQRIIQSQTESMDKLNDEYDKQQTYTKELELKIETQDELIRSLQRQIVLERRKVHNSSAHVRGLLGKILEP